MLITLSQTPQPSRFSPWPFNPFFLFPPDKTFILLSSWSHLQLYFRSRSFLSRFSPKCTFSTCKSFICTDTDCILMHLRLQVPVVILQSSISFFSPFTITKEFNCLQSLNWLGSNDLNCLLFWCIKLNLAFFFLLICFLRSNSFKFQSSLNQVFLLLFLSFLKLSL